MLSATLLLGLLATGALVNPSGDAIPFSPGFDIASVASLAVSLPSHSWEYGTASEALLELYDPQYSVFGQAPFPVPTLQKDYVKSLAYAASKLNIGNNSNGLSNGDGAVGDSASLGVSAILLGKTSASYTTASFKEVNDIMNLAPRAWNGAISQRADVAELWYVPPVYSTV